MPMTIDKAIEILSDSAYVGLAAFDQDFKDALRLGIEALKRCHIIHQEWGDTEGFPLPGETKD